MYNICIFDVQLKLHDYMICNCFIKYTHIIKTSIIYQCACYINIWSVQSIDSNAPSISEALTNPTCFVRFGQGALRHSPATLPSSRPANHVTGEPCRATWDADTKHDCTNSRTLSLSVSSWSWNNQKTECCSIISIDYEKKAIKKLLLILIISLHTFIDFLLQHTSPHWCPGSGNFKLQGLQQLQHLGETWNSIAVRAKPGDLACVQRIKKELFPMKIHLHYRSPQYICINLWNKQMWLSCKMQPYLDIIEMWWCIWT